MSEQELSMEEQRRLIDAQFGAKVGKLPASDGSRIQVTKRSNSAGVNSKGHVIAFRDTSTGLKYTFSVSVSVASAKVNTHDKTEGEDKPAPIRKASPADIACFEGRIEDFLSTIQNEIK